MSNYTVTTDFAAKDSLPSGNSGKIIKGSEFSAEFNNIATASATKADLASPTFTGTVVIPTATITTANISGGAVVVDSLDLDDNDKIKLGTGDDLELYHDGSNSIVADVGTGNLELRGTNVVLQNSAGSETLASFTQNGGSVLYYDNSAKIATDTNGVSVSGNVDMPDNGKVLLGDGDDLEIYHDGSHSYITDSGTGNIKMSSSVVEVTGDLTTTGDVGVGTASPSRPLHVFSALTDVVGRFESGDATAGVEFIDNTSTAQLKINNGDLTIGADTNNEAADSSISLRVDTTEKINIGDTLTVIKQPTRVNDDQGLSFGNAEDMTVTHVTGTNVNTVQNNNNRSMLFNGVSFVFQNQNANEKLVEMTANGAVDVYYNNNKKLETTSTGVTVTGEVNTTTLVADRTGAGTITEFKESGTTCGAVRVNVSASANDMTIGSDTVGLRFVEAFGSGEANISPTNVTTNAEQDDVIDLGRASARFDDIYATNGTINTSDANDKQSIEELSEAETRVAQACKGLVRKFKWNSAVEQKGSEARYHFGVIAQDVQAAFEAEGLDAGDYGVFVSSTWTDEDGAEQTRLGVRYTELLAFIIGGL